METAPISATPRQQVSSAIRSTLSDKLVTPEELQTLQQAVRSTALSEGDKTILSQVVFQIGNMAQQSGSQALSPEQLSEIDGLLAQMDSPQAEPFSEALHEQTQVSEEPLLETDNDSAVSAGTQTNEESPSLFGKLLDAITHFFGAIFSAIGNFFGGGDSNQATSHASAGFEANEVNMGQTGSVAGNNSPAEQSYIRDYARPETPVDTGNFDRYIAETQNNQPGEMYQQSPFHDDNKFVPRFAMAAYHESGVYRDAEDPYAVGAISRPNSASDDLGGKTYGVYQFESSVQTDGSSKNNGVGSTLDRFMNSPGNPFGAQLKEVADQHGIASREFDQLWMQLANGQNQEFGVAQEQFMLSERESTVNNFMDKAQLSPEVRQDSRIIDLIVGTTNHVGGLADGAASHIAALQNQAGRPLTANEVGRAIADYKEDHISSWFRSSPGAHVGLANRFQDEANAFA